MHGRYYPTKGATAAVAWVGGVGGGWDTPARGMFPDMAAALVPQGIASLPGAGLRVAA